MSAPWMWLVGWALAQPSPPVPIPPMTMPDVPSVTEQSGEVPIWRITRPGSHTARIAVVLHHGRQSDPDPVALRLLQRVLDAQMRVGTTPWREVGMEVQWSIGARSSQWMMDGIDGTSSSAAAAAVQVLLQPQLSSDVVARQRALWMTELGQAKNRLNRVHAAAVSHVERGVDGPVARRLTAGDVGRIRSEDLLQAHRRLMDGGLRGVVIVSGAQSGAWVDRAVSMVVDGISRAGDAPTPPRAVTPATSRARVLVDHPGGELAMITLSVPLAADADRLASQVAVAVMGGGFESRMNRALREEAGLTYAATARVVGAHARIETTVRSVDVGRAVQVMRNVLDADQPIDELEVQAVRRGMQRAAIHEMRLSAPMTANHADAMARGEDPAALSERVRAIAQLPASAVTAIGQQIWVEGSRSWIVTGNAQQVGSSLHSVGWNSTHHLDAEILWSTSKDD